MQDDFGSGAARRGWRRWSTELHPQILEMARKGAEHRYDELKTEIAALVENFPHLAGRATERVAKATAMGRTAIEAEATQVGRRTRKMSAAARKAVSDRMKKYCASRRKDKQ